MINVIYSNIESSKPDWMKNHVKNVKPLGRRINFKMPPHLYTPPLHPYILPLRNPHQYLLHIRNILHRNLHRKWLPIQDITKRYHITIFYQNRNTSHIKCLHHSGTSHFIAARANAEPAVSHHTVIWYSFGEVLVDLYVLVFVLPMLQKYWPDRTVNSSGIEHQDFTFGWGWTSDHSVRCSEWEMNFWDGNVFWRVESFRGVSITKCSNGVFVQMRNCKGEFRALKYQIISTSYHLSNKQKLKLRDIWPEKVRSTVDIFLVTNLVICALIVISWSSRHNN